MLIACVPKRSNGRFPLGQPGRVAFTLATLALALAALVAHRSKDRARHTLTVPRSILPAVLAHKGDHHARVTLRDRLIAPQAGFPHRCSHELNVWQWYPKGFQFAGPAEMTRANLDRLILRANLTESPRTRTRSTGAS